MVEGSSPVAATITSKFSLETISISTMYWYQKQPSRGVLSKRCSENMHQIYSRTPNADIWFQIFWHGWSPVDLLYIFRAPYPNNTSGGLLLWYVIWEWNAQALWILYFRSFSETFDCAEVIKALTPSMSSLSRIGKFPVYHSKKFQ